MAKREEYEWNIRIFLPAAGECIRTRLAMGMSRGYGCIRNGYGMLKSRDLLTGKLNYKSRKYFDTNQLQCQPL